jgi:hypothetical protein
MSSKGLAFTSAETFRLGMSINLFISWPILLDGKTPIMLVAEGGVVRSDRQVTAVKMVRYEFRTQKQ